MAQYDGSIRINTKIDTGNAKVQLSALAHTIVKTADEIASLRSKMDALKDVKVPTKEFTDLELELKKAVTEYDKLRAKMDEPGKPTEEYKSLQKQLQKAQSELERLAEQQAEVEGMGLPLTQESINQLADASDRVDALKEKMQSLESNGKAFIPKVDPKELDDAKKKVDELKQKIKELKSSGKDFQWGQDTDEYKSLERQLGYEQKALGKMVLQYTTLGGFKAFGKIKDSFKKLGDAAKKAFSKVDKSAKKSGNSILSFGSRLKGLAVSALVFNQISKVLNAMVSGMRESFSNLVNENASFINQVNGLKASLLTLKNALAGAFAPIVQIAIPYIQQFIGWITSAVEAVGQFIAALTGRKTYIKAIQQTAGAFEEAADSAKDAEKATEGYLSPLDEINKYSDGSDKGATSGGGAGAGGAGQMFEEVPISSKFEELAKKAKEVFLNIFTPLKQAWESQGEFVMDSWKYALEEIGLLAQSVGKDFLEVWNQPETISVLENILIIVGDIGLVVGNLSAQFKEAWEANGVGISILENIRNIFEIIVEHMRNAADATVKWSKKLDFTPLLESINGLLEALKPLTDTIGAGLEWFYKNVLLPIAGWTIEDVIPAFLNLLAAALSALNDVIIALQPLAVWLWDSFLQPLGQWAGDTIIAAMQTITDLLTKFGDWVAEHQEAVQNFAIILGSFATAWAIVTAAVTAWNIVAGIASGITTALGVAIAFLTSPIGIAIAAIGAIIALGVLLYKNWDEISAKAKEVWDFVKKKFQEFDTWLENVFKTDWTEAFGVFGGVFNAFFKNISNIWNSIKKVFNGITTFVKGVFTGNWKQAWEGVKQIFSGIWDSFVGLVKSPINLIIGALNGLLNGIQTMQNGIANALNSVSIDIPDWLQGITGYSSIGFDVGYWRAPRIPYLAQGTVVPPNREFMAVLGDNKREPEIVSPISTMKQANREALLEVLSELGLAGGGTSGGNTYNIKAMARSKVLFELMIEEGKIQQMSSGRNPFLLGNV